MTEEAKPGWADRIRSALDITMAARATIAVGVLMWIVSGAVWLAYALDPTRVAWGDYMTWSRLVWLLFLWVLSCVATYVTVRLWMREFPLRDAEIQAGWDAGVQLLAEHGKRMGELPCFVVLGCPTRHQQDKWLRSSGASAGVVDSCKTPAIDWHLRDDCLLVFLREIGVYAKMLQDHGVATSDNFDSQTPDHTGGESPESDTDAKTSSEHVAEDSEKTDSPDALDVGSTTSPEDEDQSPSTSGPSTSGSATATLAATVQRPTASSSAVQSLRTLDEASLLIRDAQSLGTAADSTPVPEALTSVETTEGQESLVEFCSRLRAARFPHSAINGALVVLSSNSIGQDQDSARRIGQSVRSDLGVLTEELGVESSITIVLAEHDRQQDYGVLSEKLLANHESLPLIGQGVSPQETLSHDAIESLADRMVENIQVTIGELMHASQSENVDRNHRLIRILIRCRRWRNALRTALVECVSIPRGQTNDRRETLSGGSQLLAGVFLASPDGGTECRNFVDPILDRMVAQQNHLAWTPASRRGFRRQKMGVQLLMFVCGLQLVLLAIQILSMTTDAS